MAIKYGFFDSIRTVDEEQNVVYDRSYTADDHNEYLNGLIARNGVFKAVGGEFKIKEAAIQSGNVTYIDPDTGTEVTTSGDSYIAVNIATGKACVNGHWVINDAEENVYLEQGDLVSKRIDMISLRWRQDQRDVILVVTKGVPNSMASVTSSIGLPTQYGYIEDPDRYWADQGKTAEEIADLKRSTDLYFDPVSNDTYGSTLEICIGFIEVPARNASDRTPKVYSRVQTSRCPYIANLITTDARQNAMAFVGQYTDAINEWWQHVQEEGDMKANLTTVRYRIIGSQYPSGHGNIIYISGANKEIPEYEYEVEDTVNLFYNGLYMDETIDYEIKVDDNQAFYIELKSVTSIAGVNSLSIEIYKGTAMTIPDASLIKY